MKDSSTASERVGRYQLLEPIGGGPSGMVSRAKVFGVAGFERQFAIKRFMPELTVGSAAQALSAAARSYGSLEHPRIARMSEFGVAQGQTFTAVEYVAGLDAFRLLQEAKLAGVPIAPGGALALVSQAARAVGYAHGRGLAHLGLSPTNVIVTADGDVKVTDFGILAATMPSQPVDEPRLQHRVPYLAPEQLAGESTSAATDVFVLGVIAYELVTGQRAYRGDTPAQVSQAILAGPPAEPPLPRPIVRVLQRCLARSPFERFPDARALADALDAALRVAPVPGTRKDVGAQVKITLDRYAALNEGTLSGMVALNLQSAARPEHDLSTSPYLRPDAKTDVSSVVPAAGATIPEIPKPLVTVPGLASPPIPVPPGVTPPPGSAAPPGSRPSPGATKPSGSGTPAKTILGLSAAKKPLVPVIPPIAKPPAPAAPPPTPAVSPRRAPPPSPAAKTADDEIAEPSGLLEVHDLTPPPASGPSEASTPTAADSGTMPAHDPATLQGTGVASMSPLSPLAFSRPRPPTPGQNFETLTGEMSPLQLDELNKRSVKSTEELETIERPFEIAPPRAEPMHHDAPADAFATDVRERAPSQSTIPELPPTPTPPVGSPIPPLAAETAPAAMPPPAAAAAPLAMSSPVTAPAAMPPPAAAAAPLAMSSPIAAPAAMPAPGAAPGAQVPPPSSQPPAPTLRARSAGSKAPLVAGLVLVLGGLGAAGWYAYTTTTTEREVAAAPEPPPARGSAAESRAGSAGEKVGAPRNGSSGAQVAGGKDESTRTGSAGTQVAGESTRTGSAMSQARADAGVASDAAVAVAMAPSDAAIGDPKAAGQGGASEAPKPMATSDKLEITSKPRGARVFIDGADQGVTPVKLDGSADRHTIVLLLPGHDLYIGEVDGHGVFDITLKPVTPSGGYAGIKVIKCKQKERYYVYVDGKPTGMTCPTERIDTVVGPHTVEVYDIVTDSRRSFEVYVKDERLSARVRIDD